MPVILLENDALHVQPLHPGGDRVARLYQAVGFGFFTGARDATVRLDSVKAGKTMLGLLDSDGVRKAASHEDLLGLARYRFPLEDLRKVTAGPHFPELSIEVRGPLHFRETYDLTPDLPAFFAGHTPPEAIAFWRAVTDLFEWARTSDWQGEWITGWLDLPRVEWEKVDGFPEDVAPAAGYRTSPLRGKRVVAERDGGGSFERLVRAILPRAARSPRRVVLTRETIFADFRGEVFMLPRRLPMRTVGPARIFGAFAGMTLEPRPGPCPVAEALDADSSK